MSKVIVLLLSSGVAYAQDSSWLIGTRQGSYQGVTYITTFHPNGTYIYMSRMGNYIEHGSWQFDGTYISQQWQDPASGQAMAEKYSLLFPSRESFVQSEGNLPEPITFTRSTDLDLFNINAPKAGNYLCTVLMITYATTYMYSPVLGTIPMSTPIYTPSPSVLGTLTLNEQGDYFSLGLNEGGTYQFNSDTKQVIFTGILGSLYPSYDGQTLEFVYTSAEGNQTHYCSLN
jgi:hypothetical protein